jgi:hypothetical protein
VAILALAVAVAVTRLVGVGRRGGGLRGRRRVDRLRAGGRDRGDGGDPEGDRARLAHDRKDGTRRLPHRRRDATTR